MTLLAPRRLTRPLYVGNVRIGGGAPIIVQSMATADTRDPQATLRQINELAEAGCEIVRIAVPDRKAAAALPDIVPHTPVPLIADIHFEHTLALKAIDAGIHGLRLNPGNIRKHEDVQEVVQRAKERKVPIRIGVNFGSVPPMTEEFVDEMAQLNTTQEELRAEHMVRTGLGHIRILEELDFHDIKISLKAFEVPVMLEAYRRMATRVPYPFHLGVTEAGTPRAGSVRSAVGIGTLLAMGIGDTIRVSLTTDPVEEVFVGYEILKSLELRQKGATMIACPTCGRVEVDLFKLANEVDAFLAAEVKDPIRVAVMGCVVNGPGEARDADVGVAAGRGKGVIFRKGEIVRTVKEEEIVDALKGEIREILADRQREGQREPAGVA